MTITLYNQKSDPHVLSKEIGDPVVTIENATPREEFSLRSGTVTIETDADLSNVNYAYIPELARYFYVGDITAVRNHIYDLPLAVDELMTFNSSIRGLRGTIDRQEHIYNGYIADSEYRALAYSAIVAKTFPNPMNNDSLILMTVG